MNIKTMNWMVAVCLWAVASIAMAQPHAAGYVRPHSEVEANKPTEDVPVETGMFESDWNSLNAWSCPDWFRDAKFGIWAHWDPQCEAEDGDWYARSMYGSGGQRNTFYNSFGHYPDHDWGYKDFCRYWTIAAWQPEELIKLYYEAGARYFMAMGQHHDNYDCWDSPYQEWNSMNIGPKRDVVGEWAEACHKYGMRLGVSMHGAHAWTFFEVGRGADTAVKKDEGTGKWWEGYDPQELYAQDHAYSSGSPGDWGVIHSQWHWGNGVCQPSTAYMQKFLNRVLQCINKYNPDMLYFDDTVLPFYYATTNPNNQYSLNILKHFYNHSANQHDGQQQVVVTGKILEEYHKQSMLWDVERGIPDQCQELPWQTCTCIGGWHYSKYEGDNNMYKQADQVIRMLVDIVSKNGNLLLSIPVRGDGSLDNNEKRIIGDITAWMKINSESIYGTRPYKVYGEGPLFESANPINNQGFNEGINYSASDVRYVQKDGIVYATIMRWPSSSDFTFTSFSLTEAGYNGSVKSVRLLGYGDVDFTFDDEGLTVQFPGTQPNWIAPVFAIEFNDATMGYETLQELINLIDGKMPSIIAGASYNTGKFSPYSIERFAEKLNAAKVITADADPAVISKAIEDLRNDYTAFIKDGKNPGGNLATTGTDITTDKLIEASGFSRSDGRTTRFGTPKYWTVENFTINNPNGTKNGIDNYPGYNTLMLGVWNGEDQGSSSDLANARIFRKVTLEPGTYYFAAQFQAAYQLSKQVYLYAATQNATTAELPDAAFAVENINTFKAGDGAFYGIEFTIDEEQEIILGFQADLTRGSNQQEIRVQAVKLIRRSDISRAKLNNLINTATTALERAAGKINDNTGFYSQEALDRLQAFVDQMSTLPEDATAAQIAASYNLLNDAYQDFLVNGLNPGGLPDLITPYVDLTIEKLIEASNFSRTEETDTGTRYGTPLYWSVQNFNIPNGSDGTKHGLDRYSGQDALMLGVWNDRGSNNSGQLTNARIYRQVHLDAGRYYFGAAFNTINSLNRAYIFASDRLNSTSTIASKSIAYYDINSCKADGQFYGIFFTIEEEQDVFLGFQANLKDGSATQEFRATAVSLLKYDLPEPDAIEEIQHSTLNPQRSMIYDLSGRRVTTPTRGFFIINGHKVFIK